MPRKNAPVSKQPSVRQVKRAAGIEVEKNAIVLLKADHREAEKLFKSFKQSKSASEQQAIARRVCEALKLHMRLEEEIFYPAFIAATGLKDLHGEALVEHDGAKKLIQEIESSVAGDPLFEAKVKVLSEMIKHHVKEEERFTGMFARARIARMDLRALGILLEARKKELSGKPSPRSRKTPRGTRAGFMGAAEVARSRGAKPEARRTP
jgi:hemerythrin superfamily protein